MGCWIGEEEERIYANTSIYMQQQHPTPPPPRRAIETRSRFRNNITRDTFGGGMFVFARRAAECAVVGIECAECGDDDDGRGVVLSVEGVETD